MKTEIKLITPSIAKEMLLRNKQNRPLNKKTILYYSHQMVNNKWTLTGQGLSFDENGNILDGQHRLHAIIHSNKSIEFLIISGVNSNTFTNYDTGKTRSGSDVLSICGVKNYATVAASIKTYFQLKRETVYSMRNMQITNEDVLDVYNKNSLFFDEIVSDASKIHTKIRVYTKTEIIGFVFYYKSEIGINQNKVLDFFKESVGIKDNELNNIPILLKDKLINYVLSGRPLVGKNRKKLIKYSIEKYLANKNLKRLSYNFNK